MIGIKGYKLKTVAAYEKKQKEIASDLIIKITYYEEINFKIKNIVD